MTVEERWQQIEQTMAAIDERHASLARKMATLTTAHPQSVETVAAMQRENEKRFEVLTTRTIQAMDAIARLKPPPNLRS